MEGGYGLKITRAQLTSFRSYETCELAPCEGVNVLLGDNGQGKTNVLEALYLCCTGRSHRTRQDRELVRWGADCAAVASAEPMFPQPMKPNVVPFMVILLPETSIRPQAASLEGVGLLVDGYLPPFT